MAANNFYGFPHAGAQYGYMLIFITLHSSKVVLFAEFIYLNKDKYFFSNR